MSDSKYVYHLDADDRVWCLYCSEVRPDQNPPDGYKRGEAFLAGADHSPYNGEANYICRTHLDSDVIIHHVAPAADPAASILERFLEATADRLEKENAMLRTRAHISEEGTACANCHDPVHAFQIPRLEQEVDRLKAEKEAVENALAEECDVTNAYKQAHDDADRALKLAAAAYQEARQELATARQEQERLQEQFKAVNKQMEQAVNVAREAHQEQERMRTALEAYADPENWMIDDENALLIWDPDQLGELHPEWLEAGPRLAQLALLPPLTETEQTDSAKAGDKDAGKGLRSFQ